MYRSMGIVIVLGLIATGCGGRSSTGSLSGSISYKGGPLKGGGIMMFIDAQGKRFPGSLNVDGSYTAPGLPPGDYVVTINTKVLKPPVDLSATVANMAEKQGGGDEARQRAEEQQRKLKEQGKATGINPTPIPEKYSDPKTSGLAVKYEGGVQTKDFPLTD
jgi:hypothetical protein